MDVKQIQEMALRHGITIRAVDEVVARVQAHFAGTDNPRPADMATYIDGLFVWDKLGMAKQEFLDLPMTERMTMARSFEPPVPVHPRRPAPDFRPTEEQQTELDALTTSADKMTRYREMRDQQQKG